MPQIKLIDSTGKEKDYESKTKLIGEKGKELDYQVKIQRFKDGGSRDKEVLVSVDGKEGNEVVGRMTYSENPNRDHIYIYHMNNFTFNKPEAEKIKNIGNLLLEVAIQTSVLFGREGRVNLDSIEGSTASFYQMGFRILSKEATELEDDILDYRMAKTDQEKEPIINSLSENSNFKKLQRVAEIAGIKSDGNVKLTVEQVSQVIELGRFDSVKNKDFKEWLNIQTQKKDTKPQDYGEIYKKLGRDKLYMSLPEKTIQAKLAQYNNVTEKLSDTPPNITKGHGLFDKSITAHTAHKDAKEEVPEVKSEDKPEGPKL